MKTRPVPFTTFAARTLRLRLTLGQRVLCRVVFDGIEPRDLEGREREIARTIFGDIETIPPAARRICALLLGRFSGKTTIAAAYALYVMLTADVSGCGPGDVPTAVTIAPTRRTAKLSIRMAREMVKASPELAPLLEGDTADGFTLRRPHDGKLVAFEAFTASRGGASARGISILCFVLDEAQFFRSGEGGDFEVNDRDVYRALIPRLMHGGKGLLISTPWPVPTLMGELFEKNFADPRTALAAKAPTLLMRDDEPRLRADIATERERDPENAAREFDCETDGAGASGFFDAEAIDACVDELLVLPVPRPEGIECYAGGDFGFVRDSSALAIVAETPRLTLLALEEMRPRKASPLKPSVVVERFASIGNEYGIDRVGADMHYAESIREHLDTHALSLSPAPEGNAGKVKTYLHFRGLVNERAPRLPKHPRLLAQLKAIVGKPAPGGTITITSPRRAGGGHGDLVSALVLAAWEAHAGAVSSGQGLMLFGESSRYGDVRGTRLRLRGGRVCFT